MGSDKKFFKTSLSWNDITGPKKTMIMKRGSYCVGLFLHKTYLCVVKGQLQLSKKPKGLWKEDVLLTIVEYFGHKVLSCQVFSNDISIPLKDLDISYTYQTLDLFYR